MQAVIDNSIAEWAHILVDLSGQGGGGGVGGQTNTLQTMLHFHQVHIDVSIDVGLVYKLTFKHTQYTPRNRPHLYLYLSQILWNCAKCAVSCTLQAR